MDHHGGILMREDVAMGAKINRPLLTVIVPAVDDYRTVFEAIRAVEDQTAFALLELLLVIPSLAGFAGRMTVSDDEIVWYLERED